MIPVDTVVEIMVEIKGKAKKVVGSMEELMVELWEVVERMVVKVVRRVILVSMAESMVVVVMVLEGKEEVMEMEIRAANVVAVVV